MSQTKLQLHYSYLHINECNSFQNEIVWTVYRRPTSRDRLILQNHNNILENLSRRIHVAIFLRKTVNFFFNDIPPDFSLIK